MDPAGLSSTAEGSTSSPPSSGSSSDSDSSPNEAIESAPPSPSAARGPARRGAAVSGLTALGGGFMQWGWAVFHILVITLQAFIFMVLTVVYLGMAHEDH